MEKLKQVLGFAGILSETDILVVLTHFKKRNLKTGEHFLALHNIVSEVAFLESGIMRVYTLEDNGNEVTKYFVRESQFGVDLESYYAGTLGKDAFQAVVNSEIYIITKSSITYLSENIPNFYIFLKSITEVQLLNKIKDNDFLNFGDSKAKYIEFTKRYPVLAQLVPQQYIASYLKITPQSLSRIRNGLAGRTDKVV